MAARVPVRSTGNSGSIVVSQAVYLAAVLCSAGVALAVAVWLREDDLSTAGDGTGLGLAIVQAIARTHGWSVAMTEGSDGGARVVFAGVNVVDSANTAE